MIKECFAIAKMNAPVDQFRAIALAIHQHQNRSLARRQTQGSGCHLILTLESLPVDGLLVHGVAGL
jgi:hypothetical protein